MLFKKAKACFLLIYSHQILALFFQRDDKEIDSLFQRNDRKSTGITKRAIMPNLRGLGIVPLSFPAKAGNPYIVVLT
jgi:hypothetical protein